MIATEPVLPPKPEAPLPGDCCGGGCARCVLDTYADELARWEGEVAEIKARHQRSNAQ
ncbi:MAG TPA: oxidoreductase-like domain-containing protein [Verrucomicrobiae bacterium]|nr:oxidoreductase-like domain-containing protein [Verrucomicrobiae bacterium]